MSIKSKKNMGFPLMIAACIFFFNPDFSVIDILPDLIGHLIMYYALSSLSDINYHFEDARRMFKCGIYVGVGEIVSLMLLFGLVSASERSVAVLLFTFVFGVADMLILIPAFKHLFDGILSLGTLYDGRTMFISKKGKNITDRLFSLTFVFVVAKSLLACLPELTSLINNSEYAFVGLLRFFAVILGFAIGSVWLVRTVVYLVGIIKDKQFINSLSDKHFDMVKTRPDLFTRRRLALGIGLICAGFILSFDFYSDYYNLIPDFLCGLMILGGTLTLKNYSNKYKLLISASAIYTAISTLTWVLSLRFFNEYYPGAALKQLDAYYKYNAMYISVIADAAAFVFLSVACTVFICDVARLHAAPSNKGELTEDDIYFEYLQTDRIIFTFLSVLAGIVTIYYTYAITSYSNAWYISMANFFTVVANAAFCAYAYKFLSDVIREIFNRYKDA